MSHEIQFLSSTFTSHASLPYAEGGVHAGFPSPSQDYAGRLFDFNIDIVRHPEATFYAKVVGDSMTDAGINEGDLLLIDRSIDPYDGCLAVCHLNGEFAIKKIDLSRQAEGVIILRAQNRHYPPITVTAADQFTLWGVIAYVIHPAAGQRL